jgi:hypothetical protein
VLLGKPCDQNLFVGSLRLVREQPHRNRIAAEDVKPNHQAVAECRLSDGNPKAAGGKERLNANN